MTRLKSRLVSAATVVCCFGALAGTAHAGAIYAPVSGFIDIGGPGFGSLSSSFDQSGLSSDFTSGVTDFATYLAGAPTHDFLFDGQEWFSASGLSAATVTYDLGDVLLVSQLALWNEDASGIGSLDLLVSTNGVDFSALSLGLAPTDNLLEADYGADVFSFATTAARYVRFVMSGCPQSFFPACSIGEVAFDATAIPTPTPIPEPQTYALLLAGLGIVGVLTRRRHGA